MRTNTIDFPTELIKKIVQCVEDAVGDDIRADIRQHDLRTGNSTSSRIWDYLNTNVIKSLETEECPVAIAHRGPWEMLVVFEKTTQCILTFMREKRFIELRKNQHKRSRMHYLDMLAKQFNSDLMADQQQLSLFPHAFSDEDRLAELVQTLLHDLSGDAEIVRHHVLVLFDTVGYQMTHTRAVMVTPTLEIAKDSEQNWSRFISASESIIVEKVDNPKAPNNQPSRGLELTPKARNRQKNKPKKKELDIAEEQGS